MGLIGSLLERASGGRCDTCSHLVEIKNGLLGCKEHDKLIISEYAPYQPPRNCSDWKESNEETRYRYKQVENGIYTLTKKEEPCE